MKCAHRKDSKIPKRLIFVKNGHLIIECEKCKLRYTVPKLNFKDHISTVYDDSYFFGGKDGYPNYLDEKENLVSQGKSYSSIVTKYTKPGKMLDVGAAAGFIMQGYADCGWQVTGIEPNQTMAKFGKDKLGLTIINQDFESYKFAEKYDLVSLVQVIGHFYDLNAAMEILTSIVEDNGFVFVESWDMKSCYARLLGKNWHEYSPPSVLNWFSHRSLTSCFNRYNFDLIDTGSPHKKISINHVLSLIDYKYPRLKFAGRTIRFLMHGNGFNLPYPSFDVFWSLFQKNVNPSVK